MKYFNLYYCLYGVFAMCNKHIKVSKARIPDFVEVTSEDNIPSSVRLYKIIQGTKPHRIDNVNFLCAVNNFIDGNKELSKAIMTEYFRKLSLEALNRKSLTVKFDFENLTNMTC